MMGCVGLQPIAARDAEDRADDRPRTDGGGTGGGAVMATTGRCATVPRADGGSDGVGADGTVPAGATVLLDTNLLMAPVEADVRVFEEFDRLLDGGTYLVPRAAREELDALAADSGGEEGRAAAVGADLADERCQIVDHEASSADAAILELADCVDLVATSDGPLRDRLLDAGVPVVSLRATNKLAITHP
jgi:rRNA-processing protein FCF1